MADGVFNIAKGRFAELVERVVQNDPADSALIVILGEGAITDATLRNLDDIQAVYDDAGFTKASFTNYDQKTVTNPTRTVVDASDRTDVAMPDQTWTAAGNGNNDTLTRLLIAYDSDTTAGTASNLLPVTFHDFSVTTDGSDLTAQFASQGFASAT